MISDFGVKDWYVAELKLKIRSLCNVEVLDITHEVDKFDIDKAMFVLLQADRIMPDDSITIAVIDPGVGSKRDSILVKKGNKFFIGPNNGMFNYLIDKDTECFFIKTGQFGHISHTFHGRDIFVPLAAKIVNNEELSGYIDRRKCKGRQLEKPYIEDDTIFGRIIYIDSFGNAITNIGIYYSDVVENGYVIFRGKPVRYVKSYNDGDGQIVIFNSSGFLEISSYRGERNGDIHIGETIEIRRHL